MSADASFRSHREVRRMGIKSKMENRARDKWVAQGLDVIQPANGASEGGYYHDDLRVSPRERQKAYGPGRQCVTCGKTLTKYNRRDQCYGCQ